MSGPFSPVEELTQTREDDGFFEFSFGFGELPSLACSGHRAAFPDAFPRVAPPYLRPFALV